MHHPMYNIPPPTPFTHGWAPQVKSGWSHGEEQLLFRAVDLNADQVIDVQLVVTVTSGPNKGPWAKESVLRVVASCD